MAHENTLPGSCSAAPVQTLIEPATIQAAAEILRQRLQPGGLSVAPVARTWLWEGFLAPRNLTLLTSQWKCGKTTLLAVLLAKLAQGGRLGDLSVSAGRAAVFSEEGADNWDERCRKLGLGNHVSLFCRPFRSKPTMTEWRGLVQAMLQLRQREGLDLVIIDPLVAFLPTSHENTAGAVMECLLVLRDLTDQGLSVLLVHHPRKGVSLSGQAPRGSGALTSHVDIAIEMGWCGKPEDDDRRRWLRAASRYEATRRLLILELAAEGTDYGVAHLLPEEAGGESAQVLYGVLEDAHERLTQRQILQQWPEDYRKPDPATISRVVKQGVSQGRICQQGSGRKSDPFRYWLPEREEAFDPGPGASAEAKERHRRYWQQQAWEALGIDSERAAKLAMTASASGGDAPTAEAALPPQPEAEAAPTPGVPAAVAVPSAAPVAGTSEPSPAAPLPESRQSSGQSTPASPPAPILPAVPTTPVPPSPPSMQAARIRLRLWPRG